jgi:regulator of sigma E protease
VREAAPLADLGLWPAHWLLPPVVGEISGGAAAEGGLRPGDRIVSLSGQPVRHFDEIAPALQRVARAGETVEVVVRRDGREIRLAIDPTLSKEDGPRRWVLGFRPARESPATNALLRYGPLEAIPAALRQTAQSAADALGMLRRMVTGQASLQNISGPVTIARVANGSAGLGVAWFLNFLAILSLSLCIMNLLPIPVLDGGHLLYYLIELVKGSPVGERVLVAGQYVGLVFLAGLMGLAFYNDLFRPGF